MIDHDVPLHKICAESRAKCQLPQTPNTPPHNPACRGTAVAPPLHHQTTARRAIMSALSDALRDSPRRTSRHGTTYDSERSKTIDAPLESAPPAAEASGFEGDAAADKGRDGWGASLISAAPAPAISLCGLAAWPHSTPPAGLITSTAAPSAHDTRPPSYSRSRWLTWPSCPQIRASFVLWKTRRASCGARARARRTR